VFVLKLLPLPFPFSPLHYDSTIKSIKLSMNVNWYSALLKLICNGIQHKKYITENNKCLEVVAKHKHLGTTVKTEMVTIYNDSFLENDAYIHIFLSVKYYLQQCVQLWMKIEKNSYNSSVVNLARGLIGFWLSAVTGGLLLDTTFRSAEGSNSLLKLST
jgi:hypothetical protein